MITCMLQSRVSLNGSVTREIDERRELSWRTILPQPLPPLLFTSLKPNIFLFCLRCTRYYPKHHLPGVHPLHTTSIPTHLPHSQHRQHHRLLPPFKPVEAASSHLYLIAPRNPPLRVLAFSSRPTPPVILSPPMSDVEPAPPTPRKGAKAKNL